MQTPNKQPPTKAKKAWNVISTVIVVLVVLLAVFLMGSRLVGLQVFNVVSGSMEPTYSVGDLLYVKDVDPDSVKVGDPITFVLNEDLVVATHRVVSIDKENNQFITKGDANETADANPVHFNNLIGVPVFSIPLLGYVSAFIQNPPGKYIAIVCGIALLAVVFLPDLLKKKKKDAEETTDLPAEAAAEEPKEISAEESKETPAEKPIEEQEEAQ